MHIPKYEHYCNKCFFQNMSTIISSVLEKNCGLALWEQDQGSDFHRCRTEPATFEGPGSGQQPPPRSRPETGTSWGLGPSQWPPHQRSPEPVTFTEAGPNKLSPWEQAQPTSEIAKWPLEGLSNFQECRVTSGLTGTVALTQPWGATICALDPLASGRVVTKDMTPNIPIRGKDG